MTFEEWWNSNMARFHWSLKHHYKPIWDAAFEAGYVEGYDDCKEDKKGCENDL